MQKMDQCVSCQRFIGSGFAFRPGTVVEVMEDGTWVADGYFEKDKEQWCQDCIKPISEIVNEKVSLKQTRPATDGRQSPPSPSPRSTSSPVPA